MEPERLAGISKVRIFLERKRQDYALIDEMLMSRDAILRLVGAYEEKSEDFYDLVRQTGPYSEQKETLPGRVAESADAQS